MAKQNNLKHSYVVYIPKELEGGVLYISTRFKTASHLCCCGCGQKVVTPLNPAKWSLTDHGSTVSLSPSIGLGTFPCRSHYWIRQSRIDWYPAMTMVQTNRAQRADEFTSQVYTGERTIATTPAPFQVHKPQPAGPTIWARISAWFRAL